MSELFTHERIAENYDLWLEYFDIYGQMSREMFEALPVGLKVMLQTAGYEPTMFQVE